MEGVRVRSLRECLARGDARVATSAAVPSLYTHMYPCALSGGGGRRGRVTQVRRSHTAASGDDLLAAARQGPPRLSRES